jgi:hypothetical protein
MFLDPFHTIIVKIELVNDPAISGQAVLLFAPSKKNLNDHNERRSLRGLWVGTCTHGDEAALAHLAPTALHPRHV